MILLLPPPPASTPFPYTTLFRSLAGAGRIGVAAEQSERIRGAGLCGEIIELVVEQDAGAFGDEAEPVIEIQRSEEHTSELQSRENLVCRLLLEKKKKTLSSADR